MDIENVEGNEFTDQNDEVFNDFDLVSFSSFIEDKTNVDSQSSHEVETHSSEESSETETNPEDDEQEGIDTPPSQDNNEFSPSLYTAIAKVLVEGGVLQEFDDNTKVDSPEALIKLYDDQIQRRVEEYKEGLNPRVKWLQDNIEQGVAMEDLLTLDKTKSSVDQLQNDSLENNEDLQKQVLRQFYQETTKFSNERIEKEISRLSDIGELENEAKQTLPELKQAIADKEAQLVQQAQKQRQLQIEEQTRILDTFKKTLNETKEIVPGLPLTVTLKDKVYKTMITPVDQDAMGNPINKIGKARMENPLEFEFKLAYLYELTDGFTKWDVLGTPAKKTAIKELENAARKMDLQKMTNPVNIQRKDTLSTNEILKAMDFF
jgi:hypothetical protein